MAGRVAVTVNRAGIEQILHSDGPGGHVHRYLRAKGRATERVARRLAPRHTGKLRASIHTDPISDAPRRVRISVSVGVPYGIYQELGTGIYAGRGYIYPKRAKAFRFKPNQARLDRRGNRVGRRGGYIFVKRIKGTPAVHFLANALSAVCGADPRLKLRFVRR